MAPAARACSLMSLLWNKHTENFLTNVQEKGLPGLARRRPFKRQYARVHRMRRSARGSSGVLATVPRQEQPRSASAVVAPRAERAGAARPTRLGSSSAPRHRERAVPRHESQRDSAAPVPRRDSVLSARKTDKRTAPKRRVDACSPLRHPPPPAERKRSRADGAPLTRSAVARRCWLDMLPDDLLALKVMTHFDTRHLLYLRLVSRKFRACMLHVPTVTLCPVRRLTPNRSKELLALFPDASTLVLAGCLAPGKDMLDGITSRNPSHVRSLCLSGNGLGLEHARQLGEWLARADGLELNSLDLSDNAICTSRQSASSAVDTGGLKSLLLPFAHARTSRCVSATCSPSKGLRSPIAGIDTDESRSRELSGSAHRLRRRAGPALIELNLSRNELCAQGSQALAAALRGSRALTCAGTGLRTLSLANCLIGEQGVNSLLPALRQCAALSSLDLTSNFLYDGGCIALCSWLGSAAAKLEHLALACNGISDEGGESLLSALTSKHQAWLRDGERFSPRPAYSRGFVPLLSANVGGNQWSSQTSRALSAFAQSSGLKLYMHEHRPINLTSF